MFLHVPPCSSVFLQDTAGEPLYKLFKALKHQVEKGPVDAKVKKAKYTLNDTGLLGDDVEYSVLVKTHTHTHAQSVAQSIILITQYSTSVQYSTSLHNFLQFLLICVDFAIMGCMVNAVQSRHHT